MVEDGADPWEDYVNPTFHALQGYSPAQMAEELRRGQFGVEGLCYWVEVSVGTLRIHPDLLKDRLERVIQAMVLRCVLIRVDEYSFCTDPHFSGASDSTPDVSEKASSIQSQ